MAQQKYKHLSNVILILVTISTIVVFIELFYVAVSLLLACYTGLFHYWEV